MWVLGIETTSGQGSVALLRDGATVAEVALEPRNYACGVFQATARVLEAAGIGLPEVGLFAVADGPGSFTGVRIGLTAVKGWVEALGTPAVGVSTLRAIAREGGTAVMDAGRGQLYFGTYPQGEEGLASAAGFEGRPVRRQTGLLAAEVGRLGLADHRAGATRDALQLDARYLQRPAIASAP